MQLLTKQQSDLLKQINVESIHIPSLSRENQTICAFLKKMKYINVSNSTKAHPNGIGIEIYPDVATISQEGKMYLINESLDQEQRDYLKDQISSLKQMANSAIKQSDLAEQRANQAKIDSQDARKDARFSKIISIITVVISVLSILVNFFLL